MLDYYSLRAREALVEKGVNLSIKLNYSGNEKEFIKVNE